MCKWQTRSRRVARSQNATSEAPPDCDRDGEGGDGDDDDDDDDGVTYGRSAWCGPLCCVWVELLLMMEIVVVVGGCGC